MSTQKFDYQVMATILMGALNECATVFLNVKPDRTPSIVTKELYGQKVLNVSTCTEFVDESFVSAVYLYPSGSDKKQKACCGLFMVYVDTSMINYLVRVFGFKNSDDAGEDMALDAVAELSQNIAGIFKREISALGYPDLEVSIPLKAKGFLSDVQVPQGHQHYYRLTSYLWGQTFVMDVILAL